MRWTRAVALAAIAAQTVLSGCGSGEDPANFSIAVSNDATLSLLQGANGQLLLTITRNQFDKDINLSLLGTLPDGVTFAFSQNPVPSTEPTVNVTFTVPATTAPTSLSLTLKASAEGATDVTVPITVTIGVRGSHTLSLPTSALTVAQGGGGVAAVRINRLENNAGTVTLAATAPAGITATFSGSPTTGTGANVVIAAAASVAAGSYNVTITGSQPGVSPDPSTTLTVTVVAAKPTTDITLAFCADITPSWFAYQNEGFNWKQVQPAGNLFSFAATDKVGVAIMIDAGSVKVVQVFYATRQELAAGFPQRDCFGSRSLTGTAANIGASQDAVVTMGGIFDVVENNAFALDFLLPTPLDLVAVRGSQTDDFTFIPDRMIVRRAVATASGALPVLDFTSGESFEPATSTLTMNGLGSDVSFIETQFGGATASFNSIFSTLPTSATTTFYSLPADKAITGDLHRLYVEAFNLTTFAGRLSYTWYSTAGNRSITLSPTENEPVHTILGTSPYVRFRTQLESQSAYGTEVRAVYIQSGKAVQVEQTAGFLGAVPATWDVSIPDLTTAAGFTTSWMPSPGAATRIITQAFSGRPELVFSIDAFPGIGASPTAGDVVTAGFRDVLLSAQQVALRADPRTQFPLLKHRPIQVPQYLRR